jgi:HD-like signal output (HDOD) protein
MDDYHRIAISDLPLLYYSPKSISKLLRNAIRSAELLETIVRYDQVLAAKLLRLANSTAYGSSRNVDTLPKALATVEQKNLQSICVSSLLLSFFSDTETIDPYQKKQLWKHSYITARMAEEIVHNRNWITREQAYLLGLIHNIGSTAIAAVFPATYSYTQELAIEREVPPWYIEREIGISHTTAGKWISIKWGLPELFQTVIRFHHEPLLADEHKPEVKLINLACTLADWQDFPQFLRDRQVLEYCKDLYITANEWESYIERVKEIRAEGDQVWGILL